MKHTKKKCSVLLALVVMFLVGCAGVNASSNVLENGAIYIGKSGTDEIIQVDSNDSWTIKSRHEDDSTYSIVTVTDTEKTIGEYPVIKLVATEIRGEDSPFAKREGRSYIIAEDEEGVYFKSVAEETIHSITQELENSEDPEIYVKDVANYRFTKQ